MTDIGTSGPRLFGLRNSNRDYSDPESWGKNQFNSAFPVSLLCYMASQEIEPVFLRLNNDTEIEHSTVSAERVFGLPYTSNHLNFTFEAQYPPFAPLVLGKFDSIDLVTFNHDRDSIQPLRALEIKLTAVPDNTTKDYDLSNHGAEVVIRPQSVFYLALRLAEYYREDRQFLQDTLNPIEQKFRDWSDSDDVVQYTSEFVEAIEEILLHKLDKQLPFVIQPIWRTDGTSPRLAEDCLDIFVWSEMAFSKLFIDGAKRTGSGSVNRLVRTVFWLAKMLFEFGIYGKFNPVETKDNVTFGYANDKAFAVSGRITNPYMASAELEKPRIKRTAIREIILGGGQNYLQPERRLDASILMTPGLFEVE